MQATGTIRTRDWSEAIEAMGDTLRACSERADQTGAYARENMEALRAIGLNGAMIPEELGGGGLPHAEVCDLLRRIAHDCPSAALTSSMHQHLVAVEVWKYRHGKSDGALLRKVAEEGLQLVSTGAKDWLESSGTLRAVDGGYRLDGAKPFASGSAGADRVMTSAVLRNEVLHFSLPMDTPGIVVRPDWDAMGMRGTGSDTVVFEDVFVPEGAIALRRPRGEWHPVWNLIATQALPLILSVYVGIAERAAGIAEEGAARDKSDGGVFRAVGAMRLQLTAARLARESMMEIAARDGMPDTATAAETLERKTLAAEACVRTVEHALEIAGGSGYLRRGGLERLYRDVLAARHHLLSAGKQTEVCGRLALGEDPVA